MDDRKIAFLVVSVVIVALLIVSFLADTYGTETIGGKESMNREDQIRSGSGEDIAYRIASEFVKNMLKFPDTAVFPGFYEYGIDVTYLQGSLYAVRGFVGSENEFGVMCRTEYYCQVEYLGNDEWSFTNFATYI